MYLISEESKKNEEDQDEEKTKRRDEEKTKRRRGNMATSATVPRKVESVLQFNPSLNWMKTSLGQVELFLAQQATLLQLPSESVQIVNAAIKLARNNCSVRPEFEVVVSDASQLAL